MAQYEPVIGIEVHLQLATKSKMYCSCRNEEASQPNLNICPICTGQPGTLPVPNAQAIQLAGLLCVAVKASIHEESVFARKNYFYPDLPKGYQISQYELPFATEGKIEIQTKNLTKKNIRIQRLHLEEDTAKMIHQSDGSSLVDFNRAGSPLVEIVTHADLRSAEEAKLYVQQLQAIARFVKTSDADMEKGQLRCDVNISLRPEGDSQLYPKTEVKNINSFSGVEKAIQYEITRQAQLWDSGTPPSKLETRGWNDAQGQTMSQRTKEEAADYRYFVEPDIPPLRVTPEQVDHWRDSIPELPSDRQARFIQEYDLSKHDAGVLVGDRRVAEFFEEVMSELKGWLNTLESTEDQEEEVWKKNQRKLVRLTFGWMTSDLFKLLNARGWSFGQVHITAENFAEFLILVFEGKLNRTSAAQVLVVMLDKQDVPNGSDPSLIMQTLGVEQQHDEGQLQTTVEEVWNAHPDVVQEIKNGRQNALMFLVGQVMKKTKGTANPEKVTTLFHQRLKS